MFVTMMLLHITITLLLLMMSSSVVVVAAATTTTAAAAATASAITTTNSTTTVDTSETESMEEFLPSYPIFDKREPPKLSGYHFKITTVEYAGYVNIIEEEGQEEVVVDGMVTNVTNLKYSGYLIDILKEISSPERANFTYELLPPSGYGSLCTPRLTVPQEEEEEEEEEEDYHHDHHPNAYGKKYRQAFRCGESDMNDVPISSYTTDMFWGLYYITSERIMTNQLTIPYFPPSRGTLGMMGTPTHINTIADLVGKNYKVCAYDGTAYIETLRSSFPTLNVTGIPMSAEENIHLVFQEQQQLQQQEQVGDHDDDLKVGALCDVVIDSYPFLLKNVLALAKKERSLSSSSEEESPSPSSNSYCTDSYNNPIGVIGDPLDYGLNYFAFGVREDIPHEVVRTLNFWLQALMECYPDDPDTTNGYCPNGKGSISRMYYARQEESSLGGTGLECGYVQYPQPPTNHHGLSKRYKIITTVTPSAILIVVWIALFYYKNRQLKKQEQRMKKRFIQQLARNIEIGPSAHNITAEKLSQAYQHISGVSLNNTASTEFGVAAPVTRDSDSTTATLNSAYFTPTNEFISKKDLAQWMNDLHLDFLSEKDFDRLWDTMDIHRHGYVDPIEFCIFLNECKKQFEQVHEEYNTMPKVEKMKLKTRRLSNIEAVGGDLEEIRKIERRIDRRSRRQISM